MKTLHEIVRDMQAIRKETLVIDEIEELIEQQKEPFKLYEREEENNVNTHRNGLKG